MKIVINRQFGGFRLSNDSMIHLAQRKGLTVYPYWSEINFGEEFADMSTTYTRYRTSSGTHMIDQIELFQKDPEMESFMLKSSLDSDEQLKGYNRWDWRPDEHRTDQDLIATVLEDGDAANSPVSKLVVVDVPDGYDYEISDYDGMEEVYAGQDLRTITGNEKP